MADIKITALPADTDTPAVTDVLPVVDLSGPSTKKATVKQVRAKVVTNQTGNHTLDEVNDEAVTFSGASSTATLPTTPKKNAAFEVYALHATGLTVDAGLKSIGYVGGPTTETLLQGESRVYRYDITHDIWLH